MKQDRTFTRAATAVCMTTLFGYTQLTHAGWTGSATGNGIGYVYANVVSYLSGLGSTVRTPQKSGAVAATPPAGYLVTAGLPNLASFSSYAKVTTANFYAFTGSQLAAGGDRADNKA